MTPDFPPATRYAGAMQPPRAEKAHWTALIDWFRWSLDSLEVSLPLERVESLAVDVFTSMAGPLRRFHTLSHLFAFRPSDPLETLAVLYHDVAYWSVDGSWPLGFSVLETVAASGVPGSPLAESGDIPYYAEVLAVFGLNPGQGLGKSGINELFSALAFASALGKELGRERTLAVVTCIEATIPFRGPTARPALHSRLLALGVAGPEADAWLRRSVHMANQDVGDFCLEDTGAFLGGTWNLLPELNPELRITAVFTIQAYRKALDAMNRFFSFLTPDILFDSWGEEPGTAQLSAWKAQAEKNLGVARRYLNAKLQAAALLEAFALATGTDVPLSLFMGAASDDSGDRLEAGLPPLKGKFAADPVFELLEYGRAVRSSFDLTNSPLAAWIYRQSGEAEREKHKTLTAEFFAGRLPPLDYLRGWNPAVTATLARALADFVPTRRQALLALWEQSSPAGVRSRLP